MVTFAVDVELAEEITDDGLPRTGSPEVVDDGEVALEAGAETDVVDPVQPFWHPLETRQWSVVEPQ